MKILTNLAETDNLPWAVQVSLLTIIDATEIQAGAIKLDGGDDYIFVGGESGGGEKALNPDCNFDRKLKLFTVTEGGEPFPVCLVMSWPAPGPYFAPGSPAGTGLIVLLSPVGAVENARSLGMKQL